MNKQQREWILNEALKYLQQKEKERLDKEKKEQDELYKEAVKNKTLAIDYDSLTNYRTQQINYTYPGYKPTKFKQWKYDYPEYKQLEKELLFANATDVDSILNSFKEKVNDSYSN